MPFESKAQMRAAFGGYLGPEMKNRAKVWADETPNISKLPEHVGKPKKRHPWMSGVRKIRVRRPTFKDKYVEE